MWCKHIIGNKISWQEKSHVIQVQNHVYDKLMWCSRYVLLSMSLLKLCTRFMDILQTVCWWHFYFIPKTSIIRLCWFIFILKVVISSFYLYGKLIVTRVILITITMSHRHVSNWMFLVMSTIHVKNVLYICFSRLMFFKSLCSEIPLERY